MSEPNNCPKCGQELWGVEYDFTSPEHYDGISEWACPEGHYRVGRWSGRELQEGELEPRNLRFASTKEIMIAEAIYKMREQGGSPTTLRVSPKFYKELTMELPHQQGQIKRLQDLDVIVDPLLHQDFAVVE